MQARPLPSVTGQIQKKQALEASAGRGQWVCGQRHLGDSDNRAISDRHPCWECR